MEFVSNFLSAQKCISKTKIDCFIRNAEAKKMLVH